VLAIDDMARAAIREIVRRHDLPEGGGLRIAAGLGEDLETGTLTISPVEHQLEQDQVVEDEDIRLFLEPVAAAYLDDKLLSIESDGSGWTSFVVQEL
jgi:hypothetical protein